MSEIVFQNLCKYYGKLCAIDHIDLHIRDREFFVILGPSGAGKTTTLKMIAGIEQVGSGTISFNGQVINNIAPEKRNVAMVFESYALYSHLSVFKNIAFPLFAPGMKKLSAAGVNTNVKRIASLLSIDDLLDRKPSELSGGQCQRVALGRALIRQPDIFLMDEPLSHLDAKIRHQMRGELKNLKESINTTIVYVTHDYNEALALGDRIAILHRGNIMQVGTPYEIYHKPANRLIAESIGEPSMNFLAGKLIDIRGKIQFRDFTNEFLIPTPPGIEHRLKSLVGKDLVIGIRPSHIIPVKKQEEKFHIRGKIFVQEILGDDGILSVSVGEHLFTVLTGPDISYSLDEPVYLTWDTSKMNYFSKENGVNLLD